MSDPANVCVVEHGVRRLYHGRWAAPTLVERLVAGQVTVADGLEPVGDPDDVLSWRDEIWAEAGAVVDVDRRILTWFFWEVVHHPGGWSTAMAEVAAAWPGWTIVWAFDGVGDLFRAAGILAGGEPVPPPIRDPDREPLAAIDQADDGEDYTEAVSLLVSVAHDGSTEWFGVWNDVDDGFFHGPDLAWQGAELDPDRMTVRPGSGLHLDLDTQRAFAWTTMVYRGVAEAWRRRWPDWQLTCGGARWEVHADLAGPTAPEVLRAG